MKEPVPPPPAATIAAPDRHLPGGSLNLDDVNPLQQAILQRARDLEMRGHWLPKMSVAQWIVSGLIAVVLVAGIFNVVDAGLAAFQRFAEVSMQSRSQPAAKPVTPPPVDVTAPLIITLVPESAPAAPIPENP